jgi:hypothetical protein
MDTYEPFLMQVKYHQCPAIERFLGGAAGPGKTRALLQEQIDKCLDGPGRHVYFRRTMDELQKVVDDAKQIVPLYIPGGVFNENSHRYSFPNGSYLRFDSLHKEDAVTSHLSEEYDSIAMDECGQMSGRMMRFLRTRMRTIHEDEDGVRRLATWSGASNPGGQGHQELLRRYVAPPEYDVEWVYGWDDELYERTGYGWFQYPDGTRGRPLPFVVWRPNEDDELKERNLRRLRDGVAPMVPNTRCFLPGRLEDNPILYNDPGYDATLWELAGDDPKLYRAMRNGDWTAFEGQVFTEFDPKIHVIPPIIAPDHWPKWRGMDWGWSAPSVILWGAYDSAEDQIVVYREYYQARKNDAEICAGVKEATPAYERSPSGLWKTVADPSMWKGDGNEHAMTKADVFAKHGVPLTPANNARLPGKAQIHRLLAIRPERGTPGLVITANCTNLIRTLPGLTYDPHKMEDVDTKGEDHAYDALRYLVMDWSSDTPNWGAGMRRTAGLRKQPVGY